MNENYQDPRIRDKIKDDFKHGDYLNSLKIDFNELKEFFLDKHKQEMLTHMGPVRKTFRMTWWLLKTLILKLNPLRRLMVLLGTLFIIFGNSVNEDHSGSQLPLLGGLLILFTLMLELKDKLIAKNELGEGRAIQLALMPDEKPEVTGWDIFFYSKPANDVGGDLIDYLQIDKNRSLLTLGDVSGKGLGAALFSVKLQSSLHALITPKLKLAGVFSKINKLFCKDGIHNRFVSLLSVIVEKDGNKLTYVNGGHLPPIIVSDSDAIELEKGDIAIGLTNKAEFNEKEISIKSNEFFIVYSDGVTETINELHQFYGTDRFTKLMKKYSNKSAEQLGKIILTDLDYFRMEAKIHDDISLLILKKN